MELSIIESIIATFEQQLELQVILQEETARLRRCILSRQLDEIGGVTHRIDEVTGKMELLEGERQRIIAGSSFGSEAANSMDFLLRQLSEPTRSRLADLRRLLRETAKETYRLNAGNRILLEEALSSVKTMVTLSTRSERASTGYDYSGKSSVVNRRKILNRIG